MDELEYTEQSERVMEYIRLKSEIDRLKDEKSRIDYGILSIECEYCFELDCCKRHEGFQDNLQKALIHFYEDEIERLKKLQEKI